MVFPSFFAGRNSGDAKPGSDGFVFSTACAMKTGEVTFFLCSSGSLVVCMSFVVSKNMVALRKFGSR